MDLRGALLSAPIFANLTGELTLPPRTRFCPTLLTYTCRICVLTHGDHVGCFSPMANLESKSYISKEQRHESKKW